METEKFSPDVKLILDGLKSENCPEVVLRSVAALATEVQDKIVLVAHLLRAYPSVALHWWSITTKH